MRSTPPRAGVVVRDGTGRGWARRSDARSDGSETVCRVVDAGDGTLRRVGDRASGKAVIHAGAPNTAALQRAMVRVMGWLAVERIP